MNKPIYRMSSAGKCPRALSAQRLGYKAEPTPEWVERAAEEGRWHEERIRDELTAEGYTVKDSQMEVKLGFPSFALLGHIDGVAWWNALPKLLEIKSMSQFEFDRWMKEGFKGFPRYADQLTCYMEATGLEEALYIVKNRSSGYEDRRIITEQPSSMEVIEGKLAGVENWLARWIEPGAGDEVYPADFDPNSLECKRCEFKHLCAPEPSELTEVEEEKLVIAAHSWREGDFMIKRGQELVAKSKETFEQHTKATGIDKWRFAELAIALIHVKETLAYPKKKLLEVFTEEQLKPASEIKLPYEYIKVEDLRKEETQDA